MAKKKPSRALSGKALELFTNVFNKMLSDSPQHSDAFVTASRVFDQLGAQGLLAIPLLFNDPNTKKACAAASTVLFANKQDPSLFDRKDLTNAARVFTEALQSSDEDQQQWSCALLSHGAVPENTIPLLRELMRRGSPATKVIAAITLCGCRAAKVAARRTVLRALGSGTLAESALAATAIARMHVSTKVLSDALASLRQMNDEARVAFLNQLQFCKRITRPQFPYLAALIGDSEIPPATRRAAIRAASQVMPAAELGRDVFTEALASGEEMVVDAAIDAFDQLEDWPDTAVKVLRKYVRHPGARMRHVGAKGLKLMGARAEAAIDSLIKQGRRERNIHVLQEIAAALVAIGPTSVPRLVPLLAGHDVSEHSLAQTALFQLGEASCLELVKVLFEPVADENVQKTLLGILMLLAENAEGAIPFIAEVVDQTSDEETCLVGLAALYNCATVAQAAVPQVTGRLVGPDEHIANSAESVLLKIGVTAIPRLEEAFAAATGPAADRIDSVIFRLKTGLDAAFKYLAHIPRDLLELFSVIGDLIKEGLGEAKCSERIKKMVNDGKLAGNAFESVSGPTLGMNMRKLQSLLPEAIFCSGPHRRRVLTTYGADLLEAVKAYLDATRFV